MTDNELLLSISDIMKKNLYPLEQRMDALDEKIDNVEARLSARIDCLDVKIDNVEQNLKNDIHLINLKLENMIIPRLNEIESCYLSTSERYQHETDKFIVFDTDLSVMRGIILEHGNRLSAIGA